MQAGIVSYMWYLSCYPSAILFSIVIITLTSPSMHANGTYRSKSRVLRNVTVHPKARSMRRTRRTESDSACRRRQKTSKTPCCTPDPQAYTKKPAYLAAMEATPRPRLALRDSLIQLSPSSSFSRCRSTRAVVAEASRRGRSQAQSSSPEEMCCSLLRTSIQTSRRASRPQPSLAILFPHSRSTQWQVSVWGILTVELTVAAQPFWALSVVMNTISFSRLARLSSSDCPADSHFELSDSVQMSSRMPTSSTAQSALLLQVPLTRRTEPRRAIWPESRTERSTKTQLSWRRNVGTLKLTLCCLASADASTVRTTIPDRIQPLLWFNIVYNQDCAGNQLGRPTLVVCQNFNRNRHPNDSLSLRPNDDCLHDAKAYTKQPLQPAEHPGHCSGRVEHSDHPKKDTACLAARGQKAGQSQGQLGQGQLGIGPGQDQLGQDQFGRRSHQEGALEFAALCVGDGGLLAAGNDLAEGVAEQAHHSLLRELLLQHLLEVAHLEEAVPVAHIYLELVYVGEFLLDFADELDEEEVELLDAQSHDEVEGELEAPVVDDLFVLVDGLHGLGIFLLGLLLPFDFLVDFLGDLLGTAGVLSAPEERHLIQDVQQLLTVGRALADLLLDVGVPALVELTLAGKDDVPAPGDRVLDAVAVVDPGQVPRKDVLELPCFVFGADVLGLAGEHFAGDFAVFEGPGEELVGLEVVGVPGGEVEFDAFEGRLLHRDQAFCEAFEDFSELFVGDVAGELPPGHLDADFLADVLLYHFVNECEHVLSRTDVAALQHPGVNPDRVEAGLVPLPLPAPVPHAALPLDQPSHLFQDQPQELFLDAETVELDFEGADRGAFGN